MLTAVTVIGLVVLAALIWLFLKTRSKDLIEEMMVKRRASSRLVSRAEFLEGMEKINVALSLAADRICYENPDIDAYLELRHIEEIEYDDETATGHPIEGRVLRLRSHGHTFEFLLEIPTARQWESMLPPRRADQGTAQAV
jgi:hypothetical protein